MKPDLSRVEKRAKSRKRWKEDRDRSEQILHQRRVRYATDPAYRQAIKDSVRRQRQQREPSERRRSFNRNKIVVIAGYPVFLWSTGKASRQIEVANRTLLGWVRRGSIPKNWVIDDVGRFWFPAPYVEFLAEQVALRAKRCRIDVWAAQVQDAWDKRQSGLTPIPVVPKGRSARGCPNC